MDHCDVILGGRRCFSAKAARTTSNSYTGLIYPEFLLN
jgi:hypothetical protein